LLLLDDPDYAMRIDLDKLQYTFLAKPLLIGGKAMEYYELRPAGADLDFVIAAEDYVALARKYPEHTREVFGDVGVCVYEFELWKCILLFPYDFLAVGAVEQADFRIISLEKLLFLKALAIAEPKYAQDVRLIVKKIHDIQYGKDNQYDAQYFQM
jgi:hypothetical protein